MTMTTREKLERRRLRERYAVLKALSTKDSFREVADEFETVEALAWGLENRMNAVEDRYVDLVGCSCTLVGVPCSGHDKVTT